MSTYLLFDGALLHGTQEGTEVLLHTGRVALYADLGEEAAQVGPVLLPSDQEAIRLARQVLGKAPQVFACNELKCPAGPGTLVEHLWRLRRLRAGSGAEFYFRYSDGRAFDATWQVLTPAQRIAVLGPVTSWDCVNLSGQRQRLIAPAVHRNELRVPLPLELTPVQWHAMLEHTRVGELFDATLPLAAVADPPCKGTSSQRHAWTAQTYRLLARNGVTRPDVRVMANRVIWQSGGHLLSDSMFKQELSRCEQPGGIETLLRYERAYEEWRHS